MKELGSGTAYNTHNTTSLIRTLKYVSDILQTEEALTMEEYKHTHTHTHTHTHRTSALLDEIIYLIVVFKKVLFFVLLRQELPNKSTSETLESFRSETSKVLLQQKYYSGRI